MICMAARCAWIDEGEGAGGLLVMRVLLAMLPQLRGVETEVRFHAPEAVRVSSKAASSAPTTPSIFGAYPCAINTMRQPRKPHGAPELVDR